MTVYVIGDVQGCLEPLERLVESVGFDPQADQLWFTGDLVNRGPDSLGVLRYVRALGDSAVSVLGNHDLHLLAVAHGKRKLKSADTFSDVLNAPDSEELLDWLRCRPLMKTETDHNCSLIHAGLLPQWSIEQANELAREVEAELQGDGFHRVLKTMYGNEPTLWRNGLTKKERIRLVINALTRMRFYHERTGIDFRFKGALGSAPDGYRPWFDVWRQNPGDHVILFGHWSALGAVKHRNAISLDSGCVWGRRLTAVRLSEGADDDSRYLISVRCGHCANE